MKTAVKVLLGVVIAVVLIFILYIMLSQLFGLGTKDEQLYTVGCGENTLTMNLVTTNSNPLEVGPQTNLQLNWVSGSSKRLIDQYGYQPPNGISQGIVLASSTQNLPGAWNVVVRGTSFSKSDYASISECFQKNTDAMNQVLSKTNFSSYSSLGLSFIKTPQIASVSYLATVYTPEEAATESQSGTAQNNTFDFICSDSTFLRVRSDNTIWRYDAAGSSIVGYIDLPNKTISSVNKFTPIANYLPQLKSCKNSEGKTLFDMYTLGS